MRNPPHLGRVADARTRSRAYIAAARIHARRLPPPTHCSGRNERRLYVYSEQQIQRLMEAARGLAPSGGLRGEDSMPFRASHSDRFGGSVRLSHSPVMMLICETGPLTIRGAKFGKTRRVLFMRLRARALARYAQQRDGLLNPPYVANFLLCASG